MFVTNVFKHWTYKVFAPGVLLREKYEAFRTLLDCDKRSHELIAELEQIYHEQIQVDFSAVVLRCRQLSSLVAGVVQSLTKLCPTCYLDLGDYYKKIDFYVGLSLAPPSYEFTPPFTVHLEDIGTGTEGIVGGKAFNLALAGKELGLPVPRGFAITSKAYHYFMEANNLRPKIEAVLARTSFRSPASLEKRCREMMELMVNAQVPEEIEEDIRASLERIEKPHRGSLKLSVRSSAVGEDSRTSFAGQYRTVLNVEVDRVVEAYKEVIASKYAPRALYYRTHYGLLDVETPMAALVLEMIDAAASGVVYTRDPTQSGSDEVVIQSIWGLGELLADGSVSPSTTTVTRDGKHIGRETARQSVKSVAADGEGTRTVALKTDLSSTPPLGDRLILELAEWAAKLEEFFGGPRAVEWCLDALGALYALQCGPLLVEAPNGQVEDRARTRVENTVLLEGGIKASGGAGAGVVHRVEAEADLGSFPEAAVLVTKTLSPDFVKVMDRIRAVVTDVGGTAGHFVSVAREFRVPVLVNTGTATSRLKPGMEVTVHADGRRVYEGVVPQLLERADKRSSSLSGSPLMNRMEKALSYISPLHLVDPGSESFAPEGCRTFHDILRFAHEKGVHEMFSLGDTGSRRARGAKKLICDIPISIYLLDLGGGLSEEAGKKKEVVVDDVVSLPFRAVWKGLVHPEIHWDVHVTHCDWKEFDRLSAGLIGPDSRLLASYAILSEDYLNLNIHFGYHFVVLDALCGREFNNNYIMLRYAGGGAEAYSRFLRVEFLEKILSHHGFKVKKTGDLIDARLSRQEMGTTASGLEMVGRLLGASRVLDMVLRDPAQVAEMVERFLGGDYDLSPLGKGKA